MILNTVNKSAFTHHALYDCLNASTQAASVLLIEDGVLIGKQGACEALIEEHPHIHFYALKADIHARGLADCYSPSVEIIDDSEFVELTIKHHTVQSWF